MRFGGSGRVSCPYSVVERSNGSARAGAGAGARPVEALKRALLLGQYGGIPKTL